MLPDMANESNLSYMGYLKMQQEQIEPGDRVWHPEYGKGTVREHPDDPGEDYADDPRHYGTHVYFDDTPETTLLRVLESKLERVDG